VRPVARASLLLGLLALLGCTTVDQIQNKDPAPLYTRMTLEDVRSANQTVQIALENTFSGMRLSWKNAASGHSGTVTPISTFKSKSGFYCRVYEETITIDNRTERYTDTACRDSDGRWKPVAVK
jgi:surface antigen